MNECRMLTGDEFASLSPVVTRLGVTDPGDIRRFIDSRLNKEYDVYLLEGKTVLKKCDQNCRDKEKYEKYFEGFDFAVPKILNEVTAAGETYILMEYAGCTDARDCSPEDAAQIGQALAMIQRHYLTPGGHTPASDHYFTEYIADFCGKVRNYFADFDSVMKLAEKRFFEAPHSLIHDDLLPINVILDGQKPQIIDWSTAGIFPYFLDLARFAFVHSGNGDFYISHESGLAFLDAYYEEMRKCPGFTVDKEQFYLDTAISAFCQYSMFLYYEEDAAHVQSSTDFLYLQKIIAYLMNKS